MDPTILLDQPGRPHLPGDVVTGTVQVPDEGNFEFLQVALVAIAIKTVAKDGSLSQSVPRKNYRVDLAIEVQDVKKNEDGDWSFGIQVPKVTQHLGELNDQLSMVINSSNTPKIDGAKAPFDNHIGHPLPPSMPPFANLGEEGCLASVQYVLVPVELKYNAQQELESHAYQPKPFWLVSDCPADEVMDIVKQRRASSVVNFQIGSKKFLPNQRTQSSGLFYKLKAASKYHIFNCQATLSTVAGAHIGDSIPLRIDLESVEPPPPHTKLGADPEVALYDAIITLERVAFVRGAGVHQYSGVVSQTKFSNLSQPRMFLPKDNAYEPASFDIGPELLAQERVPDFQTYNMVVFHRLKVEADFICAGEKIQIVALLPIKLFPKVITEAQRAQEDWGVFPLDGAVPQAGPEHSAEIAKEGIKGAMNVAGQSVNLSN